MKSQIISNVFYRLRLKVLDPNLGPGSEFSNLWTTKIISYFILKANVMNMEEKR
jgi:hypothetical protein